MILRTTVFIYFLLCLFACNPSTVKTPKKVQNTASASAIPTARSPLYQSLDYGATWEAVGQNLPSELQASFLAKFGNQLLLATDNAGLFLSDTAKKDWQQIGEGLPNSKINALHVIDNRILLGVYQAGIYESTDKGNTWTSLNFDLPDLSVHAIHEVEGRLIVGTDTGIFYLESDSKHWKTTLVSVQVTSMNMEKGKLLAGTQKGVGLSEDKGKTWRWMEQSGSTHNTTILNSTIVAMYISGTLLMSNDWGETWTEIFYMPREGSYLYEAVQLDRFCLMSNNHGVFRATDVLGVWQLLAPTPNMVFFDVLVDGHALYACTRS